MDADALQLGRDAVDRKTLRRRILQLPDTEGADVVIGRRRAVQQARIGVVAHRGRRRPELAGGEREFLGAGLRALGLDRQRRGSD